MILLKFKSPWCSFKKASTIQILNKLLKETKAELHANSSSGLTASSQNLMKVDDYEDSFYFQATLHTLVFRNLCRLIFAKGFVNYLILRIKCCINNHQFIKFLQKNLFSLKEPILPILMNFKAIMLSFFRKKISYFANLFKFKKKLTYEN